MNGKKKRALPAMLPCPFCGEQAEAQPWHGGGPQKTLVGCSSEFCRVCPSVAASTKRKAIAEWNRRLA